MSIKYFHNTYKSLTKLIDIDALFEMVKKEGYCYAKIENDPYMDFHLDTVVQQKENELIIAIAHRGVQNGDSMADPEMEILIKRGEYPTVEALTFCNNYIGAYRSVYANHERTRYYPEEQTGQNRFLRQWLLNLRNQGFKVKKADLKT